MPPPSRADELANYLRGHGTCVRRATLTARFTKYALVAAVAAGTVVEVLPGMFAHVVNSGTFDTRIAALRGWLPKSCCVSGLAALHLLGLAAAAPDRITVVAPRNRHLRGPSWLRVVRSGAVRSMQMRSGVRCAGRERALVDSWAESPPHDRVTCVLEAMRRSTIRGDAVLRQLARIPRVTGRRELVRLLAEAANGIQSYLEHRAYRTILNTADFLSLRRQVEVSAMGRSYTVDTFHEASRTVIEFDGAKVHGTRAAKAHDNARDAALATLGILTLRIGYLDVISRPRWCRDLIRRVIAARAGGHQML